MHEMSLVQSLMRQVLEVARENRLKRIDEVEVKTGALRQVVPEILREVFSLVAQGTIAEGAKLKIVEIKVSARCNLCLKVFEPKIDNFLCPDCQQADIKVLLGEEFVLTSVTGDQ